MKCIGIIPARYGSTRFPGKPLALVQGKSMIRRVYEQAQRCTALSEVVVATDHQEIFDHVSGFGKVVMTSETHQSGTDRCNEALGIINHGRYSSEDVVVNIQGDEPFIHPLQIEMLIGVFSREECQIATLIKKIESLQELFDKNIVKTIVSQDLRALYFSRQAIPYVRDYPESQWLGKSSFYKHIGLYGYRIGVLGKLSELKQGHLEKAESLEQLRWLENGYSIFVNETGMQHLSVDTPEDLERINRCG